MTDSVIASIPTAYIKAVSHTPAPSILKNSNKLRYS